MTRWQVSQDADCLSMCTHRFVQYTDQTYLSENLPPELLTELKASGSHGGVRHLSFASESECAQTLSSGWCVVSQTHLPVQGSERHLVKFMQGAKQ